ncbi:MAG: DUF1345 domain-containing protein [Chitinophagaceae bacterium]|nr:DUF1345 domain-containing protein [Chitinophagaceae bacterium]
MAKDRHHWINQLHVAYKLLFSAAAGTTFSFLFSGRPGNTLMHILLGWDVFCVVLLCFYWFAFFTTSRQTIQQEADKEDPSRIVIFILVLVCTFVSMAAVILLLTAKSGKTSTDGLQLTTALAGMILSWCLVHTLFTVNYAHLFYGGDNNDTENENGLDFPGEDKPDFMDFAYFSFVIGMTFQVSDVSIASKKIRRWALLHSLISFAYNTVIVALTINIVAGLGE